MSDAETIARLIAEVEALRLTELPQGWMAAPKADWGKLTAEVERLQARVEEEEGNYVSALERGDGFSRRAEQAEAALAAANERLQKVQQAAYAIQPVETVVRLVREALRPAAPPEEPKP